MTTDIFRPARDPHRAIYDAFTAAALSRAQLDMDAAEASEIDAVHAAATAVAPRHDLRAPTRYEVEQARNLASGHVDFGLTWACGVVRSMKRPRPALPPPADASPSYREGWIRGNNHAQAGASLDADGPPAAPEEVWTGFIDALSAHRQLERAHG